MDRYNHSLIVACHNYITRIVRPTRVTKKQIFRIRLFVRVFASQFS